MDTSSVFAAPDCVLFDLDGTLLDTAPDMAAALNVLLQEEDKIPLSFESIRPLVSHGSRGLLALGFGLSPDMTEYPRLQERYLTIYSQALALNTTLFNGMETVIDALEKHTIPWGIVTNKPGWLTEPLLVQLDLDQRSACTVSGDTLLKRKPHPEPLLYASQRLGVDPQNSIYVGDAERDIQAGKNANMKTVIASYGYIQIHEQPQSWGADAIITTPAELVQLLQLK